MVINYLLTGTITTPLKNMSQNGEIYPILRLEHEKYFETTLSSTTSMGGMSFISFSVSGNILANFKDFIMEI